MLHLRSCTRCWIIMLTAAGLLAGATNARSQAIDRNAAADVVGRLIAPAGAPGFVGVAPADQGVVRANLENFWSVALRNPALNPPKGFDLKSDLVANGTLRGPREPFVYRAAGLLYWYTFMPGPSSNPGLGRVARIDVSDHAFYVIANLPTTVFAARWQTDDEGTMYYEPREIRRVAGYPQYSNGMIVVMNSPRPLWTPVPRERVLRRELVAARAHVDAVGGNSVALAGQNKALPPVVLARMQKERQDAEACVGYLEGELARLSPADRMADAWIAQAGRRPLPKVGCSAVVDPGSPDALRIVAINAAFFDATLPRTALQLIVVDFSNFEMAGYPRSGWRRDVYERLREGLDYGALAGLLAKR